MPIDYQGILPYLFYDDAAAALDWYAKHFGFVEIGRWTNDSGLVQNAEMRAGEAEIWLDGGGRRLVPQDGDDRPAWIGIWVSDVDSVYGQLLAAGLTPDPPVTREFGVRMMNVADPFGYLWGFVRRVEN